MAKWNFINSAPEFDKICASSTDIEKFCISIESRHFMTLCLNVTNADFE